MSAAAAYSAAGGASGTNSQLLAGLVILGVGLAGLFGGALAVTTRRRNVAKAQTTDKS